MVAADAVLAQSAFQLIHADSLFCHMRGNNLTIVDEQAGLTLN